MERIGLYLQDPELVQRGSIVGIRHRREHRPGAGVAVGEQRAVIAYALREQRLTRERSAELASLAVPLTAGLSADAARVRLIAIGRFLLGRS